MRKLNLDGFTDILKSLEAQSLAMLNEMTTKDVTDAMTPEQRKSVEEVQKGFKLDKNKDGSVQSLADKSEKLMNIIKNHAS